MKLAKRHVRRTDLVVAGETFQIEILEVPFREGVEVRAEFRGETVRFSDRQLGEREALRLLTRELERRKADEAAA